MNTPARIESLLWMASPIAAWAQVGSNPSPAGMLPVELQKPAPAAQAPAPSRRRKRGKASA